MAVTGPNGRPPMWRATAMVSARSSSGATARRAMPSATARSAVIQGSVNRTSAARCQPMVAGMSTLADASVVTPREMNGALSRASVDMNTRSQCRSMVSPMPTPTPLTAASTGLGKVSRTGMNRW